MRKAWERSVILSMARDQVREAAAWRLAASQTGDGCTVVALGMWRYRPRYLAQIMTEADPVGKAARLSCHSCRLSRGMTAVLTLQLHLVWLCQWHWEGLDGES